MTTEPLPTELLLHAVGNHTYAVQSFLELYLEGALAPEQAQVLGFQLFDLTKHMALTLANCALAWKVESGKLNCRPAKVQLSEAVSEAIVYEQSIAHYKRIEVALDAGQGPEVMADPRHLQLVLRNLLNNAFKFTEPGGKVSIEVRPGAKDATVRIADTGVGMTRARQKALFTGRVSPAFGTRNEKGQGLGLWLSALVLDLQHGRIGVESARGRGSAFSLSLPLPRTKKPGKISRVA
jgi:two-component system sensor histidine kinase/response regulator